MARRLTCPQGHDWQIPDPSTDASDGSTSHCPVCGTPANTWVKNTLGEAESAPDSTVEQEPVMASKGPSSSFFLSIPGYEILAELGRGGAGVVYKARQVALDRIVALKVLASGHNAAPIELARFQSEAEAVARLRHPHIVPIHEVGQADGRPYFVLEYLPGGSLAARLGNQPAQPRQAAEMMRTLARAIHYAHQNGIIHRDLKPGNILLDADGTPKVADFGLARRLDLEEAALRDRLTPSGVIMGTPSYMAPEQADGQTRHLGPAADIYALGGILYEMLTGRPPFLGVTLTETLLQVLDAEPIAPRRLRPHIPRDLETICLRCLQKGPASRYPSAEALADDLGRFLDGQPIHARPVGRGERLLKWARRRPAQAALLAVVALALILGAAGVIWHQIQLGHKNDSLSKALAEEERQRRRNLELLRLTLEVEEGYGDYLDEKLQPLPHLTDLRRQLLERRLAFYRPILEREPDDPQMRQTQGLAQLAVGVIQQKLERFDQAEQSYRAALKQLDLPDDQALANSRRAHALTCVQFGTLLNVRRRDEEAGRFLQEGEQLLEKLVGEFPDSENQHALALASHNRAVFSSRMGQTEAAKRGYERAIRIRRQLIEDDAGDERYPRELAGSYINLAAIEMNLQRFPQAHTVLLHAEEILQRLPRDVENRHLLAGVYLNLGILEEALQPPQASEHLMQSLALWTKLLDEFPEVAAYRRGTASADFQLGLHYKSKGLMREALPPLRRSLALSRQLLQQSPDSPTYRNDVIQSLDHLAQALVAVKNEEEAEALWRQQVELLDAMLQRQPQQPILRQKLSLTLANLGEMDARRGAYFQLRRPPLLVPTTSALTIALHDAANLFYPEAYLRRARDAFRRGLREQEILLKLDSPPSIAHLVLSRHARGLGLLAWNAGNLEDMLEAVRAAEKAAPGLAQDGDGGIGYRAAAVGHSLCVALTAKAGNLSNQDKISTSNRHAASAIECLKKAAAVGSLNVADLEKAAEFAPIRARPDFVKLLRELKEKKQ
jgi:tetratricopeptide (TPR) repeat protein